MTQDGAQNRQAGDARPDYDAGAVERYNAAETAPQRRPRFADTPWGRVRAATGWSLRAMAERTGINIGDLSRIERGTQAPTPAQARRLLEAGGYVSAPPREIRIALRAAVDKAIADTPPGQMPSRSLEAAQAWLEGAG